ncbi:MAG: MFS transporter [Bacillota bacterium]
MRAISALLHLGRSMRALLGGILLFHVGWYLLLPFFAVLFTTRRGLTPAQAGLLLAVQSFTLLAGSLVGGWLADRLGRRLTMVGGLLARGLGLWGLGFITGLPALLAAVGVAGLGGGLYGPAAKAGIAESATEENRPTAFAARGIAANIGVSLGPLAGGLLLPGGMGLLFGTAALLHLGLALLTWLFYREEPAAASPPRGALREVLSDRSYLLFSLVTTLAWALFAQLMISVPLYAREILGLESSIGLLWTATSLTVILFQFLVTRFSTARLQPMTAMAIGTALLGSGLALVSQAGSFAGLLLAVLVFIAGEMLLMPTADSVVSTLAPKEMLGSYYGLATVVWGLGEGVGNLVGGSLMQYGLATRRIWLPWAVYALAALAVSGLYLVLGRHLQRRAAPGPERPAQALRAQLTRPGQPAPRIHLFRPGEPAGEGERQPLGPNGSTGEVPGIGLKQGPGRRQEEE